MCLFSIVGLVSFRRGRPFILYLFNVEFAVDFQGKSLQQVRKNVTAQSTTTTVNQSWTEYDNEGNALHKVPSFLSLSRDTFTLLSSPANAAREIHRALS